jgi:hypothetical protein
MMSFKSKTAKRALVAVVGAAAATASVTVGAGAADAAGYAVSCSGFPGTIHRGDSYAALCMHFPANVKFSIYERQINGTGKKATTVTYVLGKTSTGHLGNANAGFIADSHLHLGTQTLHFAGGGKVFVADVKVRR